MPTAASGTLFLAGGGEKWRVIRSLSPLVVLRTVRFAEESA
jgi:hypothetical protein